MIRNFSDLHSAALKSGRRYRLGVVFPDESTLQDVILADRLGMASAVFFTAQDSAEKPAGLSNFPENSEIVNADTPQEAASKAIAAVKRGEIQMLVKGNIETAHLLKAVLHPDQGLRHEGLLSHIAIFSLPTYPKLIAVSDGGMVIRPTFEQKQGILKNAIHALQRLGIPQPKVACLSAIEHVNEKIPDSLEAYQLKKLGMRGDFGNCIIEGPISLDLALSHEAASVKNYLSPVAGEADLLLVPDITSGNLLGKSFILAAKSEMAGVILGTDCPIIVTSRASTANERLNSIALAAVLADADSSVFRI